MCWCKCSFICNLSKLITCKWIMLLSFPVWPWNEGNFRKRTLGHWKKGRRSIMQEAGSIKRSISKLHQLVSICSQNVNRMWQQRFMGPRSLSGKNTATTMEQKGEVHMGKLPTEETADSPVLHRNACEGEVKLF